jgi:hypothetical protein
MESLRIRDDTQDTSTSHRIRLEYAIASVVNTKATASETLELRITHSMVQSDIVSHISCVYLHCSFVLATRRLDDPECRDAAASRPSSGLACLSQGQAYPLLAASQGDLTISTSRETCGDRLDLVSCLGLWRRACKWKSMSTCYKKSTCLHPTEENNSNVVQSQ